MRGGGSRAGGERRGVVGVVVSVRCVRGREGTQRARPPLQWARAAGPAGRR